MYMLTAVLCTNGYYVKAARLFSPVRVPGQKPRGCTGNSTLFLQCYGIGTAAMPVVLTVLDLDENNRGAILHHQSNITKTAGKIPVQ